MFHFLIYNLIKTSSNTYSFISTCLFDGHVVFYLLVFVKELLFQKLSMQIFSAKSSMQACNHDSINRDGMLATEALTCEVASKVDNHLVLPLFVFLLKSYYKLMVLFCMSILILYQCETRIWTYSVVFEKVITIHPQQFFIILDYNFSQLLIKEAY